MVKHIIVLNGLPESGKDTFASFVAKHFKGGVVMHSTIDTVKLMALDWFGVEFDVDKNLKKRRLWSDIKDAWTRYNNGPFKELKQLVCVLDKRDDDPVCVITHVREPEEIARIKKEYGTRCATVLVKRMAVAGAEVSNHADQDIENYLYDVTINNDSGVEDLERLAKRFVSFLNSFCGVLVGDVCRFDMHMRHTTALSQQGRKDFEHLSEKDNTDAYQSR